MSPRNPLSTPAADTPPQLTSPTASRRPPLFIVLGGRGGTGKSFLLRLVCERAFAAGRPCIIADGDRTNRSLPLFFDGVQAPANTDERVVRRWMEGIIETMVTDGLPVVVDLGGGDMVLKQLALELELHSLLLEHGVTPVILHLVTADLESLAYLSSMEKGGPNGTPLFAPERTALILNEGRAPQGFEPAEVFAPIREHAVFRAAVRRGAKMVVMPDLKPAYEVDRRHLSFADAAAGKTEGSLPPLGIFDRQRVAMWLRAMDAALQPAPKLDRRVGMVSTQSPSAGISSNSRSRRAIEREMGDHGAETFDHQPTAFLIAAVSSSLVSSPAT